MVSSKFEIQIMKDLIIQILGKDKENRTIVAAIIKITLV